jgi:hypothetical protein
MRPRIVRRIVFALSLAALAASGAWLSLHRRPPAMVRVGGHMNACTCTQRIEP